MTIFHGPVRQLFMLTRLLVLAFSISLSPSLSLSKSPLDAHKLPIESFLPLVFPLHWTQCINNGRSNKLNDELQAERERQEERRRKEKKTKEEFTRTASQVTRAKWLEEESIIKCTVRGGWSRGGEGGEWTTKTTFAYSCHRMEGKHRLIQQDEEDGREEKRKNTTSKRNTQWRNKWKAGHWCKWRQQCLASSL